MTTAFETMTILDGVAVSKSAWGPEDEIGRLNWLDDLGLSSILESVDARRAFDLSVAYTPTMPRPSSSTTAAFEVNDSQYRPTANRDPRYKGYSERVTMSTHSGTHIDSLQHTGFAGGCWNGHQASERLLYLGGTANTEKWPPIIARGVLVDVAGYHGLPMLPDDHRIGREEIKEVLERQRTQLKVGDVVTIRTGRIAEWPNIEFLRRPCPGLTLDGAKYLCEQGGAMCIGADNVALEAIDDGSTSPVHVYMFLTAGAQIIEILNLEELATEKIYEFAFLGFPVKFAGTTGSPLRAVAIPVRALSGGRDRSP